MSNIFDIVGDARVPRSAFNLSYEKKLTCDMGELIPVMCDEAVPGDIWQIGQSMILRMQPLLAPIMHQVNVRLYSFFVPYRILDDQWEEFITRGVDGDSVITLPLYDPSDAVTPADVVAKYTLWDYLGFPIEIVPPSEVCPIDYPRRAYLKVWNDYFRDENLQDEVDITDIENFAIKLRNWNKDYFTSSLLTQQRGTAPALPVLGSGNVIFDLPFADNSGVGASGLIGMNIDSSNLGNMSVSRYSDGTDTNSSAQLAAYSDLFTNNNELDIASLTSVDIADLRLAFQLQVWMERNNRAGVRYTEFLRAHYNVAPRDERLQRPEYIGGTTKPVLISEVLQTSEGNPSGTAQGNMSGHGVSVQASEIGKYRVQEFGVIMTLMCVTPVPAYQDGINRQWLRRNTFDFYFREFANLSEQAVKNAEICVKDVADDPTGVYGLGLFGYTGIYNEMRYKPSLVCADMRDDFSYWHLGRIFDPAAPPVLESDFIECVPRKNIYAAPSERGLIVNIGNHLNVLRPMPFIAEPMKLGVQG